MSCSIEIAAAGMSAQRRRLEVVASNLANAQTTATAEGGPYRKRMVVFRAVGLERVDDPFARELRREMRSVRVARVFQDPRPPQQVFQPGHPDADEAGYVLMPNINIVDEMINMIGAARSYEANLEVLKTAKRMSAAALELTRI